MCSAKCLQCSLQCAFQSTRLRKVPVILRQFFVTCHLIQNLLEPSRISRTFPYTARNLPWSGVNCFQNLLPYPACEPYPAHEPEPASKFSLIPQKYISSAANTLYIFLNIIFCCTLIIPQQQTARLGLSQFVGFRAPFWFVYAIFQWPNFHSHSMTGNFQCFPKRPCVAQVNVSWPDWEGHLRLPIGNLC